MTPGFLVNDRVMLDAGTISAALSIEAQSRITDIFISHTHLHDIKAVLFLADNIIGRIKQPVNIRAIPRVIDQKILTKPTHLRHFTKIPTRSDPSSPTSRSRPASSSRLRALRSRRSP